MTPPPVSGTGAAQTGGGVTRASDRRALGILTLLLLVLCLPFVSRAYFVDDYYFVIMARGILDHPARPYDFVSDDAGLSNVGWARGQKPRMVNPPLFHYFLAGVMKVWGEETWKLRTASLIFPLVSLFAVYFIGKRFVKDPLAAASLLAVTPAFWLTSYSLLLDSAMLSFFISSLAFFIAGQERKNRWLIFLSGVLIGCTILTKYTGFLIFPVVLIWHWLNRKSYAWDATAAALATSGILFSLWGLWNILTYGEMHFLATFTRGFHSATPLGTLGLALALAGLFFRWRIRNKRRALIVSWGCWLPALFLLFQAISAGGSVGTWMSAFYIDKVISVFSFMGGTSVFLFFTPVLGWTRDRRETVLWAVSLLLLFILFGSRVGGFTPLQSAMLAFFIGSTLAFLVRVAADTPPTGARVALFLFAWIALGLLELIIAMPWTAARYLLVVLPPVCWVFRRWMEESRREGLWRWAWGTTALMGGLLAYADFAQANVVFSMRRILDAERPALQQLAPRPPHNWYYLADTFDGSQPYIVGLGWERSFPDQRFSRGDLLLRSYYRKSAWWAIPRFERFQPIRAWEFTSRLPLRVMDVPDSAGFYASVWGSLPYVFSRHPLERFELYRVN